MKHKPRFFQNWRRTKKRKWLFSWSTKLRRVTYHKNLPPPPKEKMVKYQKGNKRNNNMIWLWGPLCSVNRQYKESQQRPTLDYCTPLRLSTWKSPWKMHVIRSTKSKLFHIFYHFMMIVCFSDCQCNNFLGGKHKADTSCVSLVLFWCF